ncbi:MAG: thermonuclease family protein [Pseudomonadota bacterium]
MLRMLVLATAFFFGNVSHLSAETLPGPIPADVLRVIDGDTVEVRAHIWIDQSVTIAVRLANVDAPEIGRPACRAERAIADAAKATVEGLADDRLFLRNISLGKYAGRVVAEVDTLDGTNIGAHLVSIGQAVPDGVEDPWCLESATPSDGNASSAPAQSSAP